MIHLGYGTLVLGADLDTLSLSGSVTECRLVPETTDYTQTSASGRVYPAGQATTYTLTGEMFQTWDAVDYLAAKAGDEVPFLFVPSARGGRKVTGTLVPHPLEIGGEAGTKPRAPFEFAAYGVSVEAVA